MSYPFRSILSPVDFDDNSLAAVDIARQIGRDHGGTVHLIHVVPSVLARKEAEEAYGAQEEQVKRKLRIIADARLPDVAHEIHVCAGDTAKCISDVGDEVGADLVVLATHGRTGLTHLFLGSVAEKVVRESHRPVLTVRPTLASG